jgi:hypothetical protein
MTLATMTDDPLALIQAEQRREGERVHPGASDAACAALNLAVRQRHGVELPAGYLAFLRRSDGLDFNGLVIYDCASTPQQPRGGFWQGLLAANHAWHENPALADWLVLGDSDTDLLAWHLPSGAFCRLDRVGLDRSEHFPSVDALLDAALQERL